MYRFLLLLIVASFLSTTAWAQDADIEPAAAEESEDPDSETADLDSETEQLDAEAEEIDETGLDEQGFSDVDDDFRPSEEIPADQSISFPTDI